MYNTLHSLREQEVKVHTQNEQMVWGLLKVTAQSPHSQTRKTKLEECSSLPKGTQLS